MTTANLKGLNQLREHVATLQAGKPSWMESIQDVIVPTFVCPAQEPIHIEDTRSLEPNPPDDPQQARVRAIVSPVQFPSSVQHHKIRVELDVVLSTYPKIWPRLWIRSASATPAALTDDGSFHPHFAAHFYDAIDQHYHRERNPVETLLWFFIHRYFVFNETSEDDRRWPSQLTMPQEFYHSVLRDWKTADALIEGSGDKDLAKPHTEFGSLEEWLDPQVTAWLRQRKDINPPLAGSTKTNGSSDAMSNFPPFAQEISPMVYIFPLFTKTFCERVTAAFLKEKDYAAKHGIPIHRPNNMNKSGAVMKSLGIENLMDVLQDRVLEPIAQELFPETGSEFTNHHSFLVHYAAGLDQHLDMHTDDSDVTFNCCLGIEFTGAKLQICGIMGEPDHRHSKLEFSHRPGWVICHLGRQRHGADNIDSGVRINLIDWNHNKVWRRSAESMAQEYKQESGPPDLQCLSYTHDRDWELYKGKRPVETGRKPWCPPPHAKFVDETPVYPVGD
uniref:Fe2OG dioxygenase domain-containing protein n=2 Tax=Amphora coffeiformis TaxID=265554 RepID=A0A7S3KZQ6_9STRA